MNPANVAILIVDRRGRHVRGLARVLGEAGYAVRSATTERAARELTDREHFNLIFTSHDPEGSDGFSTMEALRQVSPDSQFIFVSEGGTIRAAMDAIHRGAFDFLGWPAAGDDILRSVRQALEHQDLVADDPAIRQRLKRRAEVDIFVGESRAMKAVQEVVRQVAPTDVSVLIQGESGTGKEIVARAIHERSRRKDGPFVAVNCAALPESLIESEFFGHVRGAFTGAIFDKPGRFELARGGTLFLDEIGDLSRLGQADLLRVLEDGVYRPIGSRSVVRANARIVAAANKDLESLCAAGEFRDDLLYRLNVITISLPPLRERPEDIPPLVEMFRRYFSVRHGKPRKRFDPAAIRALQAMGWPGNVRQVRNVVERLILTSPSGTVSRSDLPEALFRPLGHRNGEMTLAEREGEWIRETLSRCGGNRTLAAKCLGISRRSLQYRLRNISGGIK